MMLLILHNMVKIMIFFSLSFGPIAFFSKAKLTKTSKRHHKRVTTLHIETTIWTFSSYYAGIGCLLYGFDDDKCKKRQESTNKTEALQK